MSQFLKPPVQWDIKIGESSTFWKGFSMWLFLFLGYMFFCINWLVMGKIDGGSSSSGWTKHFSVQSNSVLMESVNFCIPLARGIATIPAAWFIAKISHKYAVLISLLLTTISLPLGLMGAITGLSIWLFIVGRMIMAMGGALLIIYIQPVISQFFNQKNKGLFSLLNGLAYALGAILINAIFLLKSVGDFLTNNWWIAASCFAALTYIPLIGYLIFGVDFDSQLNQFELSSNPKDDTYKGVLTQRESWLWFVHYSLLLVVSILTSNYFPKIVKKLDTGGEFYGSTGTLLDWGSIYTLMFYLGTCAGMTLGVFNKYNVQKTPLVQMSCFLTLFFWVVIVVAWLSCSFSQTSAIRLMGSIICFISIFFTAFFGLGIQSVSLFIPHEYEGKSKGWIALFFSLLWGVGYIIFSGLFYITVCAFQVHPVFALALLNLFIFLYYWLSLYIREPRPNSPHWVWTKEKPIQVLDVNTGTISEIK